MQFTLVTTTDLVGARREQLARLLASLQPAAAGVATIHHVLVLQNVPEEMRRQIGDGGVEQTILTTPTRVPLSRARNIALDHLARAGQLGEGIVGFPDDDCWYTAGLLATLAERFGNYPELDFFFCPYSSTPSPVTQNILAQARAARVRDVARRASSNTMFMRAQVVAAVGSFEERIGVGTGVNGGEDTDFALRAYRVSRRTVTVPQPLVGHRDPDPKMRARYYPGSLWALARNAGASPANMAEFLRKLAIGAYLVGTRELEARAALNAAARALGAGRAHFRDPQPQGAALPSHLRAGPLPRGRTGRAPEQSHEADPPDRDPR